MAEEAKKKAGIDVKTPLKALVSVKTNGGSELVCV